MSNLVVNTSNVGNGPNLVTLSPQGSTSFSFVNSNVSKHMFIEGRLKERMKKNDFGEHALDSWLLEDSFIKIIEANGGKLMHTDSVGKIVAVNLKKDLMKSMGKVSFAYKLTGTPEDLVAFLDPRYSIYFYQHRGKSRINLYYISSLSTFEQLEAPNRDCLEAMLSPSGDIPLSELVVDRFSSLKDWWLSHSAEKLFQPTDDEENPKQAAQNMFAQIDQALSPNGDVLILVDGFEDPDRKGAINKKEINKYNESELRNFQRDIQERATYVRAALKSALAVDGTKAQVKWEECVSHAVEGLTVVGLNRTTKPRTVHNWFLLFRGDKNYQLESSPRKFPNFLSERKVGPLILKHFPPLIPEIRKYIDENLEQMSASNLQHELINNIIPQFIESEKLDLPPLSEGDSEKYNDTPVQRFLSFCGLNKLCIRTALDIMHHVGASYGYHRRSFYTNNHEKYIDDRIKYVWEYLHDLEPYFPVYVQYKDVEVNEMKEKGILHKECNGFMFEKAGEKWHEFHVDCCKEFFDKLMDSPLEDRFSVKLDETDPRYLPIGHDEALANQFDLSKQCWKGSKGQHSLRPKGKGKIIMMSGMVSRVFLWDPKVSEETLKKINESRQGKSYVDKEAALEIQGTVEKRPLTQETLPFLLFVEVGSGTSAGWWNGANMHLQLEDLADCVKILYPNLTPVFFTDFSQGHARKRADGLDASRMNKGVGGKQVCSHTSHLKKTAFGPYRYEGMLSIPMENSVATTTAQNFQFTAADKGPCWMREEERLQKKYDREIPGETKKEYMKIDELRFELKKKLDNNDVPPRFEELNKSQLIKLAKEKKIPHWRDIPKVEQGWLGQPKGLLQILWETGWVKGHELKGRELWNQYAKSGKEDESGNKIPGSDLSELMQEREDFKNELTMLQYVGEQNGIIVKMSPKCHCEIAGEAVEIVWGIGKVRMRRMPLSTRNTVDDFRALVRSTWSRHNIGRAELRGAFRTHRSYILAYYKLHSEQAAKQGLRVDAINDADIVMEHCSSIDYETIQKKMGNFKTHISILDIMGKTCRELATTINKHN